MVALGIVMLILAAAAHMTWMSMGVRVSAERRARAALLVNNRLESVANFTYAQLVQAPETDTKINDAGVPDINGLYKRTTVVAPGDDWTDDGTCDNYLVRVSVTFRSAIRPNPYQTITLSTYVMDRQTLVPLWGKP